MLPICAICIAPFDPVTRPCRRICCGHVFCGDCIDGLFANNMPCPARCRNSTRLRRRDVRTLFISVIETTVDDDDLAVIHVVQALLRERKALLALTKSNAEELERISQRISAQFASLSRLSVGHRRAREEHMKTLETFQDVERSLKQSLTENSALVAELLTAQWELREMSARTTSTRSCAKRKFDDIDFHGSVVRCSQRRRTN